MKLPEPLKKESSVDILHGLDPQRTPSNETKKMQSPSGGSLRPVWLGLESFAHRGPSSSVSTDPTLSTLGTSTSSSSEDNPQQSTASRICVDMWLCGNCLDSLFLSRINACLHGLILRVNHCLMQTGKCLSRVLPNVLLQWLAPIPEEEREPFKWHKPSGLSVCFFSLNLALLIVGVSLFLLGVLALADPSKLNFLSSFDPKGRLQSLDLGGFLSKVIPFMILIGACMIGLGYLGTIGCLLGQRLMLKVYAAIVMLSIAFQAMGALLWFVFRKQFYDDVASSLKASLKKNYEGTSNSTSSFSQLVDLVQVYYRCCGVENYTDFEGSPWYRSVNNVGSDMPTSATVKYLFPSTCCKHDINSLTYVYEDVVLADKDCPFKEPALSNPYTLYPCLPAIVASIFDQLFVLVGAAVTIVGLEVSTVTNARAMVTAINKQFAKQKKDRERKRGPRPNEDTD